MERLKTDNSAQNTVKEIIKKQYTLILAHEMMHIYFKVLNKVAAYKWSLVKEQAACYPAKGTDYCSAAQGHERNNQDGKAACKEQHEYPEPSYYQQ